MKVKVGDIITAYHKGYHRVTNFEDFQYNIGGNVKLVHYEKVANEDGKPSRKLKKRCSIDYCKVVDPKFIKDQFVQELENARLKRKRLTKLLDSL